MADYITKEQAFELLDDGDMYARKALAEMKPADVIEHSKVDKAIEEIADMQSHIQLKDNTTNEYWIFVDKFDVLDILKRNIGE